MKQLLTYFLAGILLLSSIGHLAMPAFYAPMIPEFITPLLANILAAIAELVIGVALLLPRYHRLGRLGFMFLMLAFLPVHVWDALKESPAIGPHLVAYLRIGIQFLFIYWGWKGWNQYATSSAVETKSTS